MPMAKATRQLVDGDGAAAGPRRLTAQGLERKQQLLDSAAALFAERGYAETRVLDIVRRAGVAKGLFYWYFENKEALFRELVVHHRQALRKAQAAAMDPDAEPLLRIRQGVEATLATMSSHAHFFAMLQVENLDQRFADLLVRGSEIHVADTIRLIKEGIADGTIREEEPELLALGVNSAVAYYGHFHRTGRVQMPITDLAEFVGRYVVRVLAVDDEIADRVLRA